MKRISFGMTIKQYEDGTKDVTRRLGWRSESRYCHPDNRSLL